MRIAAADVEKLAKLAEHKQQATKLAKLAEHKQHPLRALSHQEPL
jgi:hypothetical protein